MLNYILDELKKIMAIDSPSGFTRKAADYIMQQLREFGFEPELTRKGCVLCCLGGEGSPVVFSAHIDTLGGMVSEVKSNGRLKLTRIGGMNANNAECENARVYTRDGKVFEGCFQMNNPSVHVNGEYDSQKRSYDNMELVLDRSLSEKRVFPAIDLAKSSTRRDDLLYTQDERLVVEKLRRDLSGLRSEESAETIIATISGTSTNGEFISKMMSSM